MKSSEAIKIFEDNNLIIHFIRGYIDGDGCISYNNINKTNFMIIHINIEK